MRIANTPAEQPAVDSGSPPAKRKRGPGAPPGNSNRSLHGVRGYLCLGRLPKSASYVRRQLNELRRQLETAVGQTHGEISLYHAALVQSTCRHETRATLLGRYLRSENLTLADRLGLLKEIGAATDSRDRCLKLLGLDQPPRSADPWSALDAAPPPTAASGDASDPGDSTAGPAAPNAADAKPDNVEANGKPPDTSDATAEGIGRQNEHSPNCH